MAVDAVHRAPLAAFLGGFAILIQLGLAITVRVFDLPDLFARLVRAIATLHARVDVPVNARSQLALGAAYLQQQRAGQLGIHLVFGEMRADCQLVANVLGRPMALFASLRRRA